MNPDIVTRATRTNGMSSDGGTFVGETFVSGGLSHAFRYCGPGTFQDLGLAPGPFNESYALGVSGDGSAVVGYCEGSRRGAFRWTEAGGMQNLGTLPDHLSSQATAISRDGSVVVGSAYTPAGDSNAFVWTAQGGMAMLPPLPGSSPITEANGVSFDGRFVVGESGLNGTATMWLDGQPIDLGVAPGWGRSLARGVSDDGTVVVGHLTAGVSIAPAIWTPSRGMELLSNYLAAHGVNVPGGQLSGACYAVSSDGRTIVGGAHNPATMRSEGFVVTIPSPPTLAIVLGGAAALAQRRRPAAARA